MEVVDTLGKPRSSLLSKLVPDATTGPTGSGGSESSPNTCICAFCLTVANFKHGQGSSLLIHSKKPVFDRNRK